LRASPPQLFGCGGDRPHGVGAYGSSVTQSVVVMVVKLDISVEVVAEFVEENSKIGKRRSFVGIGLPAFHHLIIEYIWTRDPVLAVSRVRHPVTFRHAVDCLLSAQT